VANKNTVSTVTRTEFYAALTVLWLYVSFAFITFEPKSNAQPWMSYLFWGCSLILSVAYAVLTLRNRKANAENASP
jgi:hypothetical protein